jgi:methyl-accepting chemotaxis protein
MTSTLTSTQAGSLIATLTRRLLVALITTSSLVSATAGAQPAAAAAPGDSLTTQDRDVLAATEQLATEGAQVIEQWVTTQAITEPRVFARLYFPIPKTDPQKYTTPYDTLADRDLVGPEDKALARSPLFQYAILTDINGYIPAHNARFAQALTGNLSQDYIYNRTKRMMGDPASLAAARNDARFLLQRVRLETGDVIYEVSVPVMVRGKHWGCARIGYRRTE